ncbi:hypothetical protein BH20ACI1_BH20ACI1_01930 [soil metagenome]
MVYIFPVFLLTFFVIAVTYIFYDTVGKNFLIPFINQKFFSFFADKSSVNESNYHHKEIMEVLLGLDDEKLDELLELYKQEFGKGAARYARKTYRKWESGKVKPITQTFERFLVHLPKVMDFDLKCEVLRHLMEEYCAKDNYDLSVYTDDWEKTLEPLVQKLIDKPYNANLPKQLEDKLTWLADDDMQAAEDILKKSQVEEGKIAVSMLRQEFAEIENLLEKTKDRSKVLHKLKFPYGTINLEIKRR